MTASHDWSPENQRLEQTPIRLLQTLFTAIRKLDLIRRDALDPFTNDARKRLRQVNVGIQTVEADVDLVFFVIQLQRPRHFLVTKEKILAKRIGFRVQEQVAVLFVYGISDCVLVLF